MPVIVIFIFIGFNVCRAANLSDWGDNLSKAAGQQGAGYDTTVTGPEQAIGKVIQAALSVVGVIFLILMIYGGYLWMTARGNEPQVEKAKNLITAAIIGLVIVLAAYAISIFVVDIVSKQTLMQT